MVSPRLTDLLVVDGYNLLHAAEAYRGQASVDVEAARRRLVDDVAVFAAGRYEAVVVFDGHGGDPAPPSGTRVEFSGSSEADAVVEGLAFAAREQGRHVLVVTSDRATRDVVAGRGVEAISSATMLERLAVSEDEWREQAGRPRRSTVADRLDPALRAELERRARE